MEKRSFARNVGPQVRHEMPQVVFFGDADGAVGEKHECSLPRETAHGVIRIDPRIHAFAGLELGSRRPQLGAND